MNHDATHCLDYRKNKCPKKCYRAQLTQELKERYDLFYLSVSWANFKGGKECPIRDVDKNEEVVTEMESRGDLVYVVRCKYCKNYIDGKCDTILDGYTGGDDFYCAAGELRGNGDDHEPLEV